MEDSDELRWALKIVIKRQMRDLLQQLHDIGEEMAVLTVNVSEGTASHFGTNHGEWFLSEQKNIKGNFLKYCQSMSKKTVGRPSLAPLIEDINATIESSITTNEEVIPDEPPSSRKSQIEQKLLVAKGKKPQPVVLAGSKTKPGKAVIKIKVPKGMITSGTSDKDLSGLVGKLLEQELKAQKSKTDSADSDTQNKFSSLLEAANIAKEQVKKTMGKRPSSEDAASVAKRTRSSGPSASESPSKAGGDTPSRSLRSGRAVSSRFLEGIASLKPKTPVKAKEDKGESDVEDHSDMDQGESVNLEGTELETVSAQLSKELEQMTLPVLERLETATSEGEIFDNREIKRQDIPTVVLSEKDLATTIGQSTSTETITTVSDFDTAFQRFLMETSAESKGPTRILVTIDNGIPIVDETIDIIPETDAARSHTEVIQEGEPVVHIEGNIQNDQIIETVENKDLDKEDGEAKDEFVDDFYVAEQVVSTEYHPYACRECNKIYQTHRQLYLHNHAKHRGISFKCGICQRELNKRPEMKKHMVAVHTVQCHKCETINVENGVWSDKTKASDVRKIACNNCGEVLTLCTKYGPKSKRSSKQGGSFIKTGDLIKCAECGKLFVKESDFNKHKILHLKEKPLNCHLCAKSFTQNYILKSHLKIFHPDYQA